MGRGSIFSRREQQSGAAVRVANMVRRLAVVATSAVNRWQLAGHVDDEGHQEVFDEVPVYQHVGFVSRPKAGTGKTKAVLLAAGGSSRAVAVIASDDPTGKPALSPDEAAVFNSQVRVICTADGHVLVDNGAGAVALALKSDVQAVVDTFNTHAHAMGDIGTTTPVTLPTLDPAVADDPTGTVVLKAK